MLDKIGQLKIADSATSSEDRGYQYDTAWNLNYRTNNSTLKTFSVDGLNQLTSVSAEGACSYDANGNMTVSHSEKRTYVYDDENRLVQLYVSTSASVPENATEFIYDGLSRLRIRREYIYEANDDSLTTSPPGGQARLQKKVFEPLGSSWTLVSETRYIYDGWRVIQERAYDAGGGGYLPTVSYTRGTDLSGSLEGAGGIGGLLGRTHGYSAGNWSTHNFYHADGNGNITYMVNSSQTVAASYRYDPYGNLISSSGTLANDNTYRFSSKMIHVLSGLYYYGYRWYEPNFQRWPNRDPIAERGGANLYGFVANNPLSRVDFLGFLAAVPRGPASQCQDPCGDAKKKGLDKGYDGGVVCCGGKKYSCVWKPGKATNPKAVAIVTQCITEHEDDHHDDIDCPKFWCYGFPTRPPYRDPSKENAEECAAYKLELSCYQANQSQCGGDPQCIHEVNAEIQFVTNERATRNCPP